MATDTTIFPRNWEAILEDTDQQSTEALAAVANADRPVPVALPYVLRIADVGDVRGNTSGIFADGDLLVVDQANIAVPLDHSGWLVYYDEEGDAFGLVNPGPVDTPFEAHGRPYGRVVALSRSF